MLLRLPVTVHGPVTSPVTSPRSISAPRSAPFSASLFASIVASIFASLPASLSASPALHGPPSVDCDYRRARLILSQSRRSIVFPYARGFNPPAVPLMRVRFEPHASLPRPTRFAPLAPAG